MLKKISLLAICIATHLIGSVCSVDKRTALMTVSQATDETMVFVHIDLHELDDLYQRNFNEELKKAHLLCAKHKNEGYEFIKFVNDIMSTVNPLYLASYRLAPHVIGLTRRPLRWSHLVRATCYEQEVQEPAKRFLLGIEKTEGKRFEEDDYDYFECNTGILYIDSIDIGKALSCYVTYCPFACYGVIYVDTDLGHVESVVETLQKQHPSHKVIGLHVQL